MRVYRADGTYTDTAGDDEFGWYLGDIVVDEGVPNFSEENRRTRELSADRKWIGEFTKKVVNFEDTFDESSGMPSDTSQNTTLPTIVEEPDIPIDAVHSIQNCEMATEGEFANKFSSNVEKHLNSIDINFPQKENLINLINPYNPESKMLLSILSFTRYKHLESRDASDAVFRTINFRSTKYNHIINDQEMAPNFKCLVNDQEVDSDQELLEEIQFYNASKEDNMLSLMMELIVTDMDSNVGDMSELNECINDISNCQPVQETSDLGNSIQSNCSSKEGVKRDFLEIPNRSEILSSLGLSDEIDKSIQSWTEEKTEMHKELIDIKEKFLEDEKQVNRLLTEASNLEKDLRETHYLENVIRLLNGNTKKFKNNKSPFRIFLKTVDEDTNLIV